MAQVDILVFGASGFTGEYICRELASQYSQEFTYGLAGRSQAKLEKVQNDIKNRGLAPPSKIVVADVKNEASLLDMAKSCRLLINAVGPYRFFGLQVVEACIKGGCHYVDISGEPWFLESSEFKFNELAKKNKVYSISACGFDSIPSDLGVEFTRREFSKIAEDGDQVNEIQAYLSGSTGGKGYVGHATTLICAVHGFSSVRDLIKLRKEAIANDPLVAPIGPKGRHLKEFHKVPNKPSHIVIKFPGSDRSIVLRSQQRIAKNSTTKEAAIQYFMYASFKNGFFSKLSLAIFGLLLTTMTKYAWGRNLFIKYPKLFSLGAFSHEGPTEEQCRYATFQIDFNAKSANNQTLKTRVVGDIDPGYTGTAAMVSAAAVTVLKDIDLLPENGGVMTTAYAFRNTHLLDRLSKRRITFEVVE